MTSVTFWVILFTLAAGAFGQRPFYLTRPFGYPVIVPTTESPTSASSVPAEGLQQSTDALGNRFDDSKEQQTSTTSTEKPYIPIVFQNDPLSYYYFLGLPIDQRPFHVVNAPQIEEWNTKPHNFPLKPNHFIDSQANVPNFE